MHRFAATTKRGFISTDIADIKMVSVKEKDLTNCLESLRQSGSSYRR
jgi:hypothetical protein